MRASRNRSVTIAIAVLLATTTVCSKSASQASNSSGNSTKKEKIDPNLTDLPTYPHLTSGTMLGHPPHQGGVYDGTTDDDYATVVAWYRARLKGAKESHSGFIDTTTGRKEIEFHMDKWNEVVAIAFDPQHPGTGITLGQDAHQ